MSDVEKEVEGKSRVSEFADTKTILLEPPGIRRDLILEILREVLLGGSIQTADTPEDALDLFESGDFQYAVADFQNEGYTETNFIKAVNNQMETSLVAFSPVNMEPGDAHNRFKIDPLRKLFEKEKKKA